MIPGNGYYEHSSLGKGYISWLVGRGARVATLLGQVPLVKNQRSNSLSTCHGRPGVTSNKNRDKMVSR